MTSYDVKVATYKQIKMGIRLIELNGEGKRLDGTGNTRYDVEMPVASQREDARRTKYLSLLCS